MKSLIDSSLREAMQQSLTGRFHCTRFHPLVRKRQGNSDLFRISLIELALAGNASHIVTNTISDLISAELALRADFRIGSNAWLCGFCLLKVVNIW